MNDVDGSEHFAQAPQEESPCLLTIVLDTNPAAWSLLAPTISLSQTVANLLVFINAHLACNYTNKIAVVASHCGSAQWLYPTPTRQHPPQSRASQANSRQHISGDDTLAEPTKRLKINGPRSREANGTSEHHGATVARSASNKYRPFRLIEEELLRNLTALLAATSPSAVSASSSTMIAGALTLALSYINRETIAHAEAAGVSSVQDTGETNNPSSGESSRPGSLQSRILLLSVSPSTDLAHQYIPIMNSIFACQRLNIPIDILSIPRPADPKAPASSTTSNSTVFLQQACDATHGIFIPLPLLPPNKHSNNNSHHHHHHHPPTAKSLLQTLLLAFLPPPSTRAHLVLPTRTDVDFRAACFCHRRIIAVGFVCSICLSIFCDVPEDGECLTCGTRLTLAADYGAKPVVVAVKRRKNKHRLQLDA